MKTKITILLLFICSIGFGQNHVITVGKQDTVYYDPAHPNFVRKAGMTYIATSYPWMSIPYFALPDTGVVFLAGETIKIYGDALINFPINNGLRVNYICDIGTETENDYTINPTISDTTGYHSMIISFYNYANLFYTDTIFIKVKEKTNTGSMKIMLIGDSTTDGDADDIGDEIDSVFSGNTITYLGTRNSSTTRYNEAFPGYGFKDFATGYGIAGQSNFIFGDTLNVPQYFITYSVDTPDVVYIRLGINDVFPHVNAGITDNQIDTILMYADTLINAFLALNDSINIVFELPTTATNKTSLWNYGLTYSHNGYIEAIHHLWKGITDKYAKHAYSARVYTSYMPIAVNRATSYYNGVHLLTNVKQGVGTTPYLNDLFKPVVETGVDTIKFISVQPATLNQVALTLMTSTTLDTIYVDWGEDAVVKVSGITDQVITSAYGTNNKTYTIKLYGDLSRLTKLICNAEATVQNLHVNEFKKKGDGLTYLYLNALGPGTTATLDSMCSKLTYFNFNNIGTGISGSINDFVTNLTTPGNLTTFALATVGTGNGITGTLSNLPVSVTALSLNNVGTGIDIVNGTMKAWLANITITSGYTTASVDGFLNAYAPVAPSSGTRTINLAGITAPNQPRSSASDDAVTTLTAKFKTVQTTP